MMRLKWEILIGILAMLVGIVFIRWYISEFQNQYSESISVISEKDLPAEPENDISPTHKIKATRTDPIERDEPQVAFPAVDDSSFQEKATADDGVTADKDLNASLRRSDDPDLGRWSENAFINKLNKRQKEADISISDGVRRSIVEALEDHTVNAKEAYLSSITKELSSLSITTTRKDQNLKLNGDSPAPNTNEFSSEADPRTAEYIVVKEGESLSTIATRLYSDPGAYLRIFELNKDILASPNSVVVGQKLRLPSN
jgi:nucleoid-associated protein YgaU